ncbi:MAG: hypothetical protein WCV79_02320 [Candidatus Paceibacterota bacterium]
MDSKPKEGLPINEVVPLKLVPGQERISGYIDGLNAVLKLYKIKPSSFLDGATFLCNQTLRHNPDWIAQSAHSLREIGYLFSGTPQKRSRKIRNSILVFLLPLLRLIQRSRPLTRSTKVQDVIRIYLEESESTFLAYRITETTHILAEISHHHSRHKGDPKESLKILRKMGVITQNDQDITGDVFINLTKDFLNTILSTISAQLTIHKKIDLFCQQLKNGKGDKRYLAFLLASNADARKYFYAIVSVESVEWIENNGFLEIIKQKSDDTRKYAYKTPELDYLSRVVETNPKKVADIILSFDAIKNLNLETIDRFLWICTKMSARQLARIIPKINQEKWVPAIGNFNHWSFEYKQIFDKLSKANDSKSIVTLAEAVLSIRTPDDIKRNAFGSVDNPFYLNDLHFSEVFEQLPRINPSSYESAFDVLTHTLGSAIALGEKEDDVFAIGESFPLFDFNFFSSTAPDKHYSSRDDVRDLAITTREFANRLIGSSKDLKEIRRIYEKYIGPLPDSRSLWRLRLYIWSLHPEEFKSELRSAFFRGVESENNLWPVTGGAEYEQALKKGFFVLDKSDKELYIQQTLTLFENIKKSGAYGYGILSSIFDFLSDNDKKRAEVLFKHPLKKDYSPRSIIGESHSGYVIPQAPSDSEEIWKGSISIIIETLKTKWTPESLQKLDMKKDFLKPINAEGVATQLIANIKERLPEFIEKSELFFDRDCLDSHYTYSFLRGVQEAIRANSNAIKNTDVSPLIRLGKRIADSGILTPFDINSRDRDQFDAWLSGWNGVCSSLSDVMTEILRNDSKSTSNLFSFRTELLSIISFLLKSSDPKPADEQIDTAKMKTMAPGENEYQVSDPLTCAINSTRGRAFETFIHFVQQDSQNYPKESRTKLSKDIRDLYEEILASENTRAITFMFGHYIAFFYYRDPVWMEKVIPIIFTRDPNKIDLYMAAWEGYISSSLYDELFKQLQHQYSRAIALDPNTYTKRTYRTNLDEGLATHMALAYAHFDDFDLNSELFKTFWATVNSKRAASFISFIGRSIISRDQPKKWLQEHPEVKAKKLEEFWDWALQNCNDKEALQEFGFWMQTKDDIFKADWLADHIEKTLAKTCGDLEWEIGFIDSLPTLAQIDPEKTLKSIRSYLIDGSILKTARGYIRADKNLIDMLTILYKNKSTRDGTYKLINDLLPIGGGQFWSLKKIIEDNP